MPREPALLTSAGRMPERSQHRVSEGQDARSERPATGRGQPRPANHLTILSQQHQFQRCHGVLSERLWKQETVSMANMIPR
jgi:hypothetical protein